MVDLPYSTLPPVPSSVAPVAAAEWLEDLRSALVAQEPPESVDPITGSSTPDSDCWRTLEPATVSALTLLVQPNPFGAHPFKVLRDVVRVSSSSPTVALERPQNHQSNLLEESLEHVLVSPRTEDSLEYVLACPQPEEPPENVLVSPGWDDLWNRPSPAPYNLDDDFLPGDGSLLTNLPARSPFPRRSRRLASNGGEDSDNAPRCPRSQPLLRSPVRPRCRMRDSALEPHVRKKWRLAAGCMPGCLGACQTPSQRREQLRSL